MKKLVFALCIVLFLVAFSGCQPSQAPAVEEPQEEVQQEEEVEEAAPVEEEEQAAEEVAEPEAAEEVVEETKVGGEVVMAIVSEPATLLSYRTSNTVEEGLVSLFGGTLTVQGPDGKYYPYLAKSWEISDDALTYTFHLREDVKFHDGTPMTSADFVYAFNRALEVHPFAGWLLGPLEGVSAPDDYTFVIQLAQPNAPLLLGLSLYYLSPVHEGHIEEMGEDAFGRNPIGVGPYIFKEWSTADRVVMERNPEFTWGPESWASQGPFNIETITVRILPDAATIIAGLEAGEIDYSSINVQDLPIFDNENFKILSAMRQGVSPYLVMNLEKPPFDDVRVRKALNLALNRQATVDLVARGHAKVQSGPLSPSMVGYWEGVEEIGYSYQPEEAAELMREAGYELNDDGVWEKDGVPFEYVMYSRTVGGETNIYEVIQQQLKEFGMLVEIQQYETGILLDQYLRPGEFEIGATSMSFSDCDLLTVMFHTSSIGANNFNRLSDPEMDEILTLTRTATSEDIRLQACADAQKLAVEGAYIAPIYTLISYSVVNGKVNDITLNPISQRVDWSGAWISE